MEGKYELPFAFGPRFVKIHRFCYHGNVRIAAVVKDDLLLFKGRRGYCHMWDIYIVNCNYMLNANWIKLCLFISFKKYSLANSSLVPDFKYR
ncbi:unnamed protein product [Porites lobata]|uniref:Uncharacterized protein n=1 Tax=Porites lobata TaxID=104759 RepID=A0ABN8NLH6_9CNID|nr:unnamed protein product [Porites lobata]